MPSSGLQPPAHAGSSLADISTLKMVTIRSSEVSVHTRTTQHHIPEGGIFHSHHRENFKSYIKQFILNCIVASCCVVSNCSYFCRGNFCIDTIYIQYLLHISASRPSLGMQIHYITLPLTLSNVYCVYIMCCQVS
jgi:hypothetical protein